MANISTLLQKIMDAVYGEEVRGSIHDALSAMNTESSNAMEYASTAQDSAQASAATASQKASEASESAHNAASSETSALSAAANAEQKAGEALTASQNAASSEASALSAAADAEQARAAAANSADYAAESAISAEQYSGNPPRPDAVTKTWWIWDASQGEYVDSHIGSEIEGPRGLGIEDIRLTSGTHSPGTTDIYTVELTDGTTYNISVWNGRNGEGTGDVLGNAFDLTIPASGWLNGQITIADERFIALSTYKYFISADGASREEFLDCKVQPQDISTTGFITFTNNTNPETDLTVSIIRFELSANG